MFSFNLIWKPNYSLFALFAICTISFSLVQDVFRPLYTGSNHSVIYMLGVLPNFLPAIGLPALFMIILPYFIQIESASVWVFEKIYLTSMVISAGGLIVWEFIQLFTSKGHFDWHDLLWTLIGTVCFYLLAVILGIPSKGEATRSED